MNKLLQRILLLSIKISQETEHDVMCEYLGHTNGFNVRIHNGGWVEDESKPMDFHFYLNKEGAKFDASATVRVLEAILKNSKLEVAA